ncbi:hypothetical protein EJB05_14173, partial [Eragrostis curvula]
MAPQRRPRSAPSLMDDVVGEILLRVAPDEPAHLIRAAVVCKSWRRILLDPGFPRRYREFHRTPPLLGILFSYNQHGPLFLPAATTTAPPFSPPDFTPDSLWTLDCRHGRVLFYSFYTRDLILWDPVNGDQRRLSSPRPLNTSIHFSAAVLCAAKCCDHLDCHGGPFLVVFAGSNVAGGDTWVSEYLSETGAWSASTNIDREAHMTEMRPNLFTGDAVYFIIGLGRAILKYELGSRCLSLIDAPGVHKMGIAMMVEDGGLGFAGVKDHNLCLWSWKANAKGIASWVWLRDIELTTLLPVPKKYVKVSPHVSGFVEGTDTIFISTDDSIFTLKLKSRQIRKVGHALGYGGILPYMSFYTPDCRMTLLLIEAIYADVQKPRPQEKY